MYCPVWQEEVPIAFYVKRKHIWLALDWLHDLKNQLLMYVSCCVLKQQNWLCSLHLRVRIVHPSFLDPNLDVEFLIVKAFLLPSCHHRGNSPFVLSMRHDTNGFRFNSDIHNVRGNSVIINNDVSFLRSREQNQSLIAMYTSLIQSYLP